MSDGNLGGVADRGVWSEKRLADFGRAGSAGRAEHVIFVENFFDELRRRVPPRQVRKTVPASCYSCGMVRREIEIDEDTNRLLTELALEYEGDLSLALADLVHAREGLEEFAERSEAAHESTLLAMRDRSEADFREGRTVTWEDVKTRNGL